MIWVWNPINQKWASSKGCIFHIVPCQWILDVRFVTLQYKKYILEVQSHTTKHQIFFLSPGSNSHQILWFHLQSCDDFWVWYGESGTSTQLLLWSHIWECVFFFVCLFVCWSFPASCSKRNCTAAKLPSNDDPQQWMGMCFYSQWENACHGGSKRLQYIIIHATIYRHIHHTHWGAGFCQKHSTVRSNYNAQYGLLACVKANMAGHGQEVPTNICCKETCPYKPSSSILENPDFLPKSTCLVCSVV